MLPRRPYILKPRSSYAEKQAEALSLAGVMRSVANLKRSEARLADLEARKLEIKALVLEFLQRYNLPQKD